MFTCVGVVSVGTVCSIGNAYNADTLHSWSVSVDIANSRLGSSGQIDVVSEIAQCCYGICTCAESATPPPPRNAETPG